MTKTKSELTRAYEIDLVTALSMHIGILKSNYPANGTVIEAAEVCEKLLEWHRGNAKENRS